MNIVEDNYGVINLQFDVIELGQFAKLFEKAIEGNLNSRNPIARGIALDYLEQLEEGVRRFS